MYDEKEKKSRAVYQGDENDDFHFTEDEYIPSRYEESRDKYLKTYYLGGMRDGE